MEYVAAAVAVGRVNGAMINPCRSFKFRNVELTSFAGVLKVYLQPATTSECGEGEYVGMKAYSWQRRHLRSPKFLS